VAAARAVAPAATRVASIDIVRGLVMIIMPLEHAREFFAPAPLGDPVDLSTASAGLFLTRLLTHLCAPTFVFLAGLAAGLRGRRLSTGELSRWLAVRGLWLVFLEITAVNFAWTFSFAYPRWFLQVIWALGLSMLALAALVRLRMTTILVIGVAIVAGHNLLDGIRLTSDSSFYIPWAILHQRDLFVFAGKTIRTSYPVLPWIGVMALGYCASQFYSTEWTSRGRRTTFQHLGLALLSIFAILRVLNVYGDPSPFTEYYIDPLSTVFSVFNTTKYPPSLLFVTMTLGAMFLLLAGAEAWRGRVADVLVVYGRAPLFFYVAHWTVLHVIAVIAAIAGGTAWSDIDFARYFAGLPRPLDFSLAGVYGVAAAAVALLYWPCLAIGRLKARHSALASFI
jgi:uncharacterized membrane protein